MNASRRNACAMLLAALGGAAAPKAHACGELMLRSLGAMRFHAFATRSPAAILLYSGAVANQWPESVNAKLHDGLEKVGHNVHRARGPVELVAAIRKCPWLQFSPDQKLLLLCRA